jgi:hypothetical protein
VHELSELLVQLDLLNAAVAGRDRHGPGSALAATGVDDPEVVEPEEPGLQADRTLGRLDGERIAGAAAIGIEMNPTGQQLIHDHRRSRAVEPAVVEPVGQADEVARKSVAADVGRLPEPLRVDLVREGVMEWAPVARAASVVLPVGAHEQEGMLHGLARSPGKVHAGQIVVVLELDAA